LLRRSEASSTSLREIVVGEALASAAIVLVGALVLWVTMSVGFSTSWGNPVLVLLVLGGVIISSLGITLFVTGVTRTEERLDVLSTLIGFVFGLVGGNLILYHRLPRILEGV